MDISSTSQYEIESVSEAKTYRNYIKKEIKREKERIVCKCLPKACQELIKSTNPPVFFFTLILLVVFLVLASVVPDFDKFFGLVLNWISIHLGWFYVITYFLMIALALFLIAGPFSTIKLGTDYDKPEFTTLAWFSMLFSAGMGIGLVFYGVAEPITYYNDPPYSSWESRGDLAGEMAVPLALFHWCIHGWAVYMLFGLCIGYFSHRIGLPSTIRSVLYPLLGKYIYRWPGHVVDIISVFGCLFGLATSLAYGSQSINSGMKVLWGVPYTHWVQVTIIAVTTIVASMSMISGLDKGVKILSQINFGLAALLGLFVIIVGPTQYIIDSFLDNINNYVLVLVERIVRIGAFHSEEKAWVVSWTIFYWGWWASYAPFVGMFIARISKGRTIREFVSGVMIIPSIVTIIWFTVFGSTAIYIEKNDVDADLSEVVAENYSVAIYAMLKLLPLGSITCFTTMVVTFVFFVTSSDSGSYVVDMLTSAVGVTAPIPQRLLWAFASGIIAAILLSIGTNSIAGLQACVVCIALPLCILAQLMMWSILKALYQDPKFLLTSRPDFGKSLEKKIQTWKTTNSYCTGNYKKSVDDFVEQSYKSDSSQVINIHPSDHIVTDVEECLVQS